jgi:archaellum component FlaF (FlaF/FlaG flagellin family)
VYNSRMKKRYILIIVALVVASGYFYVSKNSEEKLVQAPIEETPKLEKAVLADWINVDSPAINEKVSSPVTVKGTARGSWFFEASAPVDVVNWDGLIIGQGYMTVDEGHSWMTTDYVPFTGTITYDASQLGAYDHGWIIFKRDNPSGESKFDRALEVRVLLK